MPSVQKDRPPTGRLGRLITALRPTRAGPLPVQTGFPTSLADLVVKNHGRLKKPSSKRKNRGVSQLPSPSPSPPSSPLPFSPTLPFPATQSPSTEPRPYLSPVESVCHARDHDFSLGLGFLTLVGVVSLALLVIWNRKVVSVVTILAFSLVLLESIMSCWLRRMPLGPAATLDLSGRGYVSPIREVEADSEPPRQSSSDLDRGSEASLRAISDRSVIGDDRSKQKTKKRFWKKIIANKLQKDRKRKDAGSSGSFGSETGQSAAMIGGITEANQADAEASHVAKSSDSWGSRHGMGNEEVHDDGRPVEIDSWEDFSATRNVEGSQFPAVVVAAVVLVGLVAGRLLAVAFTVLFSVFIISLRRSPWRGVSLEKSGD